MSTFASPPMYPALSLFPLNDTFQPKHILLSQRAKIGRQSNAKTAPTERNGFFDTKVISRQHAEVWAEDGKIWIKDVKSSNGTYVNTQRLAGEGIESEPFELHSGDILELGTDIASDDNTKIVHHKVAARVTCILTAEDAAAFAGPRQQHESPQFAYSAQAGPAATTRRPIHQMGNAMGGLGGNARAPGQRSGPSFDHILSKIQSELQKSREAGADLHGLTTTMNDIQDTLGGTLPVVPSQPPRALTNGGVVPPSAPPPEFVALQSQLNETQSWIAGQVDKFKSLALDNVASELTALRHDVDVLRELMQAQRVAQDTVSRSEGAVSPVARALAREEAARADEDDDDAQSVATLMPEADRDSFEEEDEAKWADNVRPSTPEPISGDGQKDDVWQIEPESQPSTQSAVVEHDISHPLSPTKHGRARLQPKREKEREEETARQLESVLSLARELERQHAEANETIRALQDKVIELEARESFRALEDKVRSLEERHIEQEHRGNSVQQALDGIRVEWATVREDWNSERARIAKAVDEFESAKVVPVVSKARPPPSPPKSEDVDSADSGEASGDLGEEDLSRVPPLPSPKRKKNRRRKSNSIRRDVTFQETELRDEEWERHALLTPSSMSSGSSGPRRIVNGRVNGIVNGATTDSVASSVDSLPGDGELDHTPLTRTDAAPERPAIAVHQNLTPIAGTLALCVIALAIAYGRDLRLIT